MELMRLVALAIGYAFGLILSGYLFGKKKDVDIRKQGSGNIGTTNTMRILGIKVGALTLVCDCLKCVAAVVVVWLLFRTSYPEHIVLLELYGALGAILGHDFPFFMKFKGGKGIACSFGMIIALFPQCLPLCVLIFVLAVAITRYVSLGSILAALGLMVQIWIFGAKGWLAFATSDLLEAQILVSFACILAIVLHRGNIKRLLAGFFCMEVKERKMKVGVIGAGSWGCALAILLQNNGCQVSLWGHRREQIEKMQASGECDKLPGVMLPKEMSLTWDLSSCLLGKDLLVLAVPSTATRETAEKIKPYVEKNQILCSVSKGIEEDSLLTQCGILEDVLGKDAKVGVLSGPSHAEEVVKGLPTVVVAGSRDISVAEFLQNAFMNENFRVYTSTDVTGIEIGASLKNVIALAAGMSDGLGYGDNTKAALITRGIKEISSLALAMGGLPQTLSGLAGTGDLIVTCSSRHSRNRKAGMLIGQGLRPKDAMDQVHMVVEGVYSAKAALALGKKYQVSLPIIEQVNEVLFHDVDPRLAVRSLMERDKKSEIA